MTEPSQYFKGRTVQEQMNEVIGYVDTRAAEVATAAIASDVAQVHQDKLDADADAQAAAASATAAAGTLVNAVKKTGEASQSIAGDIAVAGDLSAGGDLAVTGDAGVQGQLSVLGGCDLRAPVTVPTPSNNTDATTKKYVDDADALKLNITDVNNYAIGLTGNQTKAGQLTLTSSPVVSKIFPYLILKDTRKHSEEANVITDLSVSFTDGDGIEFARIRAGWRANGSSYIQAVVKNTDNTDKYITLAEGNQ